MITVNYLANALPINNKTTGEISASLENLFVPAGITFSIWGIIYLMLIVFVVLQFKTENKEIVSAIGMLFIASCLLNSFWIFAWHYQNLVLSLIIMLLLLASLTVINIKIADFHLSLTKAVFGIYLGWICIATIANFSAYFTSIGWSGSVLSEEVWTIIMILVGVIITIAAMIKFENPFIGLSVIWAFAGIAIKQNGNIHSIFIIAICAGLLSAILTGFIFYRKLA